jgi:hypothetical protein
MIISTKILYSLHNQGARLNIMDYDLYDKIAARYGDNQPVGGVVFIKPVRFSNNRGAHVGIDSYGRGDTANIKHLGGSTKFATSIGKRYWNRPMPFPSDVSETIKAIRKAKSVVLGVDSDPFTWMDRKYQVTKEVLLQLLNSNVETVVLNTRSDLVAMDEYLGILTKLSAVKNIAIMIHVPTQGGKILDEHVTRCIEPGAPSIKRRLEALNILKQAGISAYLSNDEVDFSLPSVRRELGLDNSEKANRQPDEQS